MFRMLGSLSVPAVLSLVVACDSVTAPPSGQSRLYVLTDIDGTAVPAALITGIGDTTTVFWATLSLDPSGQAIRATQFRHAYLNYRPDTTTTVSVRRYREEGDSITVGFFTTCPDICLPNEVGRLADSTLTLTFDIRPRTDRVYRYRLAATY
jgi:hypothetical protein